MKTPQLLLILLFAFLFSGCNKDDETELLKNEGLVIRIENNDHKTISEWEYNKNNTLKESWNHLDYFQEGKNSTYTYSFNSQGQLIKKEGFEPGNMLMSSYSGAMDKDVINTYSYNSDGTINHFTVECNYNTREELDYTLNISYQYPSKNLIVMIVNNVNPTANSVASYTDYVINNDSNIEEMISYNMISATEKHIYSSTKFTYDKKKAPHSFEPGPVSKNNILTKTITSYYYDENGNQSIGYTSDYTYEYTYNDNGYPEKSIETYPNEIQNISYYFYK